MLSFGPLEQAPEEGVSAGGSNGQRATGEQFGQYVFLPWVGISYARNELG